MMPQSGKQWLPSRESHAPYTCDPDDPDKEVDMNEMYQLLISDS